MGFGLQILLAAIFWLIYNKRGAKRSYVLMESILTLEPVCQ